jgi:hypothetical protein
MDVGIEDRQVLRPHRHGEQADETSEDERGADAMHAVW